MNSTELTYNVKKSCSFKQDNPQTASKSEGYKLKAQVTEVLTLTNLNLPGDVTNINDINTSKLIGITDKSVSIYSSNDAFGNSIEQFSNSLNNILATNSLKDKEVCDNKMLEVEKVLQMKADSNLIKSSPDAKKLKLDPITDIKVEPTAKMSKILYCNIC